MKRKIRKILSVVLIFAILISTYSVFATTEEEKITLGNSSHALGASSQLPSALSLGADDGMRLWYTSPADTTLTADRRSWMYETLPIGNGYMGNLLFGGITNDRIHINEETMWAGGPKEGRNYIGGNLQEPVDADVLAEFRAKLDNKTNDVFGIPFGDESNAYLNQMMGDLVGFNPYQDFADMNFDFSPSGIVAASATNYVRDLDMSTALSTVSFDHSGTSYKREYFTSYPDEVFVSELTASELGKIGFDLSMKIATSPWTNIVVSEDATNQTLTYTAELKDNKLKTEAQIRIVNEGGTVTISDGVLQVRNADKVMIIMNCGTNYKNDYPVYRGDDPHAKVSQRISAASQKSYDTLKERHIDDHQELFDRVSFGLNTPVPNIPTNTLVENYRDGDYNKHLEIMVYQYGRYLMIAGSREGGLPMNLQGVWGIGSFSWYGDYHFNINLQMNYWPVHSSNLAECAIPLNDYIDSLRVPGRISAARNTLVPSGPGEENGWLVGCFSNPYGFTALGQKGNQEAGWNIGGSSWIMQNVYDHYRYTGDETYLRDKIYPMLRELAVFWENYLWWSDNQQRLAVAPSVSAENGPTAVGTTYDQSLAWQTFEETIEAAEILGVDADKILIWRDMQEKLNPILIGEEGQVKEWYEETTFGRAQDGDLPEIDIPRWRQSLGAGALPHRHASHLVGLYPGTLINKDTPEFMDAAIVSLEERGLEGTGWARANKINLWSRTGNSEKSYQLLNSIIGGGNAGILGNLLNSHGGGAGYLDYPIFQIEGNFGITAGINEMLMQSQLGYTQFLPALPEEWDTGHISGIVSRGNFEITMDWKDEQANYFAVTSNRGGEFIGEYKDISTATISDSQGNLIDFNALNADKVSFDTDEGETYYINFTDEEIVNFPVNGVGLNTNAITLYTGETAKLLATVTPVLASNKSVAWASSNPTVATVDTDGNIAAIAEGTTVITVTTTDGGFSVVANITVQERPVGHISVTNVIVSPATLTLDDGEHSTLVATVQPDNATNPSIVWHSEDAAVVSVDATGNITAHSSGTVKIIATAVDGGKFGIAEITVKGAVVIPEPEPEPKPEPPKNSSGSGGGSSKGTQVLDKSPNIAGSSISQAKPLTAKKAKELFNELLSKNAENKSSLNLKLTNYSTVNQDVLKELKDSAEKSEISVRLLFDRVENNSVITRLSIPTSITNASLNLTENSLRAERIKAMFGKYFTNKLSVLSLNQTESFSEPIEIIHKLPADLNNSDIVVYSYSLETNTYVLLQEANVFVDGNGYIHFTTSRGGNFIFSQGVFTK